MDKIFFDGWFVLVRTLAVGVLAYAALIVFLRLSGKRTLAQMNAFDLIVTVSLGSTLASILVSADVALAQGLLALGLLIALQFVITWSSVRSRWVRKLVTGEPSLLVYRGELLPGALRRTRVTEDEVRAVVRSQGLPGFDGVEALVLETNGSFSVVRRDDAAGGSALESLRKAQA